MLASPTISEKTLLALLASPQFGEPSGPWCWWFAWFPVRTVDDRFAWLRTILRRRYHTSAHLDGPQLRWWIYARVDSYF